jgi:hypothetical protein
MKKDKHAAKLSTIYLAELEKQGLTVQLNPVRKTLIFFKGKRFTTSENEVIGEHHERRQKSSKH